VVAVRLADDPRGRVPFALLGVLVLVGSAAFVALDRSAPRTDRAVDRSLEAAASAVQTTLRQAVVEAGRDAARDPVIEPANTTYGRVLDDETAFRDALRARIYLAARDRFAGIAETAGDATAGARLAPVRNASALEAAIERVRVERAGPNGTALRVTVDGVRVSARRGGRTVATRQVSPTATVASPVLALHDRVETFQRRLDAGPLRPGLGRRLTASLYAITWARGYAQYGGAPIASALSNRHVEVATGAGALAIQRSTLGGVDPGSERAHWWALAHVAVTDLLAGAGVGSGWVEGVLGAASNTTVPGRASLDALPAPSLNATQNVSVGRSADRALEYVDATGLNESIASVYHADVRVLDWTGEPTVYVVGRERPDDNGNWTLVGTENATNTTAFDRAGRPVPPDRPGWRQFERFERVVVDRTVTTRHWRDGDRTRTTRLTRVVRTPVAVSVLGRHSPNATVPRNGIAGVYEPGGGPLDGPNLAGVPDRAVERLVADRGGRDALARRAVEGTLDTDPVAVPGVRPDGLRTWIAGSVVRLHRWIRRMQVEVERGALGTYEVNPPAELADYLRQRRRELIRVPETYGSVAQKARTLARLTYFRTVVENLEARADRHRESGRAVEDRLEAVGGWTLRRVRGVVDAARAEPEPSPPPASGLGGPLRVRVKTVPSYLTLDPVSRSRLAIRGNGTTTPLTARNVNVFSVPHADVADALVGEVFDTLDPDRVRLRTAATALAGTRKLARRNATVTNRRRYLRDEVDGAVAFVRERLRARLAARGVGANASVRESLLDDALSPWRTPGGRARALTNGSALHRIATVATEEPIERALLLADLRGTLDEALSEGDARPRERVVNATTSAARDVARDVAGRAAAAAGDRVLDRGNRTALQVTRGTLGNLSAGLPVAPVPGYWYATLNVWHVESRGIYERVTVRARRGTRDTVYVRDNRTARLDVDGDGVADRLGRSTRVEFDVATVVVVVVPPGPPGVGDTDGNVDETSPGWPWPG